MQIIVHIRGPAQPHVAWQHQSLLPVVRFHVAHVHAAPWRLQGAACCALAPVRPAANVQQQPLDVVQAPAAVWPAAQHTAGLLLCGPPGRAVWIAAAVAAWCANARPVCVCVCACRMDEGVRDGSYWLGSRACCCPVRRVCCAAATAASAVALRLSACCTCCSTTSNASVCVFWCACIAETCSCI